MSVLHFSDWLFAGMGFGAGLAVVAVFAVFVVGVVGTAAKKSSGDGR